MTRVLVVCTANMCRSPMAEALLQSAGQHALVSSAGTHALGDGAAADAVTAMQLRGIDIGGHRPRQVTSALINDEGADLILTMEREHVRYLVTLDPRSWVRTLTLKELLRRSAPVGRRSDDEPLTSWLQRVTMGRRPADLFGSGSEDDVDDPIGRGLEAFQATADELDDLLRRAASLVGM